MSDKFDELGLRLVKPEEMSPAQRKRIEVIRNHPLAFYGENIFHEDGSCYFKGDDPVFMVVLSKRFIDGFTGIEGA